ncbi:MAG: c-type cytochrome, partial [Chitinophagaceae bacterium]
MNQPKSISVQVLFLSVILIISGFCSNLMAQDGKALFTANCASCHAINKKLTGPALAGLEERGPWSDRKKLVAWIHNPVAFSKTDAYAANLLKEYNGVVMTAFPQLTEPEIDAIVKYINTPVAGPKPGDTTLTPEPASDNSFLFGILALVLAVVAFILLQVNSNLKKLTDEKEGIHRGEPLPFWKNKAYIATGIILLFLTGGYLIAQSAIGLGRQTNYQP